MLSESKIPMRMLVKSVVNAVGRPQLFGLPSDNSCYDWNQLIFDMQLELESEKNSILAYCFEAFKRVETSFFLICQH